MSQFKILLRLLLNNYINHNRIKIDSYLTCNQKTVKSNWKIYIFISLI